MLSVVNAPGKDERVEIAEVEDPLPKADEALVAVHGISINRGELSLLAVRPAGWRPGQDVAGVVEEAAADGSGPGPGTRVVGLVDGAGWSRRVAVATDRIAILPDEVTIEQAATLPIAGLTALRVLRRGGPLLGRRVLVTGANGAVGRFLIELARISGAAVVTAVTTRVDQIDSLIALGATSVVESVETADGTYDVIAEAIGGGALEQAVGAAAPGAVIVVYGASSGEKASLNVYDFLGHEEVSLVNYMSYASIEPVDRDLATLLDLVASGRLHPTIGHRASWRDLSAALSLLEERGLAGGKVVLSVS